MRICGIVSEYNPFHNGHKIHIEQTRKKTDADLIVCVMSGNFVQRGEPAIFDKWTRAYSAVLGGADAVIEMPFLSAVQSAEGFAYGGINALDALGADLISFGSETDDIETLKDTAYTLFKEQRSFRRSLKKNLESGVSFPKARMQAAFPDASEDMTKPNAILAIEYIKAIYKTKVPIEPIAIKRVGQGYHSEDISTELSSATAIRIAVKNGNLPKALASMPDKCAGYISAQLGRGLLPVFPEDFDNELLFRLRLGGPEYISTLHEVSEGLENRIFEAAKTCTTRQELIERIKTKRYTYTRISRILLYSLFGITRAMVEKHNKKLPKQLHLLAAKDSSVLSALSKKSYVPLVTGKSDGYSRLEIAASDVYALTQNTPPFSDAARDFTQKLLIIDK